MRGAPHWNPSATWTAETGLPFVFATWLIRSGAPVDAHLGRLHAAAERGIAARTELAEAAAPELGLPAERLVHYLAQQCVFRLGDEMERALRLYGERARALGLASQALGTSVATPDGAPCRG